MFILIDIDKQFFKKLWKLLKSLVLLRASSFYIKKNIKQSCNSCFYLAFYLKCNLVKLCCEI